MNDEADRQDAKFERVGETGAFAAKLRRLGELAPEPYRTQLYRIAQGGRRAA